MVIGEPQRQDNLNEKIATVGGVTSCYLRLTRGGQVEKQSHGQAGGSVKTARPRNNRVKQLRHLVGECPNGKPSTKLEDAKRSAATVNHFNFRK